MLALLAAPFVHGLVLLLHLVLPARVRDGHALDDTGRRLRYRLNGLRVFAVTVALYAVASRIGLVPWDLFYRARWASLASACAVGLLFTLALVLRAPPTGRGLLADLYLGRLPNPRLLGGRVDAKVYLYLAGATLLELNVLSFTAHHVLLHPGQASPGVLLYAALFTFFVVDYLVFEEVHLYTYDFVAERVGFKLGWGCLAFYPFFYGIGLWSEAELPDPGRAPAFLLVAVAVFLAGWVLSRGANLQKFHFKRAPGRHFLGLDPLPLGEGEQRILTGGFWGIARHVNYLGEVLMAIGLTLCLGRAADPWPWLYPLYYVALLVPRQRDDDARCARKYGALWEDYVRRVPYRIIPGVY